MKRLVLHVWLLGCAIWPACDSDRPADAADAGASDSGTVERPDSWDDSTHGQIGPDYSVVFDDTKVHRIDIVMTAQTRQEMLDDMTELLGEPGSGGFGGVPGGGGPGNPGGQPGGPGGFPQPSAAAATACEGKNAGDACESELGEGSCASLPGALLCLPANFAPPGGGMGGPPGGGQAPGGPGGGPLNITSRDPNYVPVTVRYDDRAWTQVAMRYKGNSSLAGTWGQGIMKIGFRLHFDHFEDEHPEIENQRFFGFRELTFSSGWNDDTLTRDALAAELLADMGLPAARWAFYRIYVDIGSGPVYWGLYTALEDPSDALPSVQFADGDGNVYKPEGEGSDFTHFAEAGFEKKTNEKDADYADVIAAIDALHATDLDPSEWREQLEATFDVDTFLKTLAVSRAIGHWDSYGRMAHNYYLYGDRSQSGRLVWISWDHNLTWQGGGSGIGLGGMDLSVMMDEVNESWPLIRFLLDDPIYRAKYRDALQSVLQGSYAKTAFDARATALHDMIMPYVLGGTGGDAETAPYTLFTDTSAFLTAVSDPDRGLSALADQRRSAVEAALAAEAD